jgi:threonine synthase
MTYVKYISTRGNTPSLPFDDILLLGLAPDGGLFLPEVWPTFSPKDIKALRGLSYSQIATRVISPFLSGTIEEGVFDKMIEETYAAFDHPDVAPLREIGKDQWLLELFFGPTLSFKDYALQLVGRLFDHVLSERGRKMTVVCATSGDTGSAAIEACRDRKAIEIFVLHPKGRVSDVQRRQMTTVTSSNVHNLAIEGTFDDCQNLVKEMFNDADFRDTHNLGAVNSINWARIMAQIAYYFYAAVSLGAPDKKVSFSVPTGNFGNIYAALGAKTMGLPIDRLIIGSNKNDILTRFFETGRMQATSVIPTLSPSMDIQLSSNFERFLFDLYERDADAVCDLMARFKKDSLYGVDESHFAKAKALFEGARFDDDETKAVISSVYQETKILLDPHSAIGVGAGRKIIAQSAGNFPEGPLVSVATAHPAKFPDAVEDATGIRPSLPDRLADLFERDERIDVLANDLSSVKSFIASHTDGDGS